MITEQQVLDSLRPIMDPDLGRDIVSLGFVKNVKIDGGAVSFSIELTTPACPVKDRFKRLAEEAVRAIPGVTAVTVTMTAMQRPQHAAPEINTLAEVEAIVAVSSAKGGVGKSTVAVNLARALTAEGLSVGVLDADLYGPSFPTLFNIHRPEIYGEEGRIVPLDIEGMKVMSFGFLLGDSPAVLRGPLVSTYVNQLLTQTDWGRLDYLIIDMPPGTGDIQLTITQRAQLAGAVIVTTPHTLSLVDVAKGILMFEKVDVPVLGVVENMSFFVCDNCQKKHHIFGAGAHTLTERFGLPTLAEIPLLTGLASPSTPGAAAFEEAMRELAGNLHRAIGKRRIETARPVATKRNGYLHVQWPDGTENDVPGFVLRASCGCAQCVNEFTGEPILDAQSVPPDIEIQEMEPLGNYALSITWSDGHSSGIYSWELIRRIAKEQPG
jgi:Mrp family chromosome partitioning ATPase/DUF971 family protein